MNAPHVHRDVYMCEGSCQSVVTKAEFDSGKQHCGTAGCSRFGHAFAPRVRCETCGRIMTVEESKHPHG